MLLSRDDFLKTSSNGVWCSQVRSPNELSLQEIASRAVKNIPGIPAHWHKLCEPFVSGEPDYDTMEEQNSEEWIYTTESWMDLIYDQLPLDLPTATVYRLQTTDGQGVFAHGVGLRSLVAPENGCPQNDPKIERFVRCFGRSLPQEYQKSWFFGCQDLDQIKNWLNASDISSLHKRGIEVGVYEIGEQWCVHGDQQSVFQKDRARLIDSISLNEIFAQPNPLVSIKLKR